MNNENIISILFVDDEEPAHTSFTHEAQQYQEKSGHHLIIKHAASIDEARALANQLRFDCIITDLRLAKGEAGEARSETGNRFINELKKISPCLIAVLTARPDDVVFDIINEHSMRVFKKKSGVEQEIFEWVDSKSQLSALLSDAFRRLNLELAPIFHFGMAERVERGSATIPPESFLKLILESVADNILMHSSESESHPNECYIYPILREKILTGDIIELENSKWVVVTPPCDIVRIDAEEDILLAQYDEKYEESYETALQKAQDGAPKSIEFIRKLLSQASSDKFHVLPSINPGGPPAYVRFDTLKTIKYSDAKGRNRIAAIAPRFLNNLTYRFSSYIGRPGSPDLDIQHYLKHVQK